MDIVSEGHKRFRHQQFDCTDQNSLLGGSTRFHDSFQEACRAQTAQHGVLPSLFVPNVMSCSMMCDVIENGSDCANVALCELERRVSSMRLGHSRCASCYNASGTGRCVIKRQCFFDDRIMPLRNWRVRCKRYRQDVKVSVHCIGMRTLGIGRAAVGQDAQVSKLGAPSSDHQYEYVTS